jgi:50S ribosomal protein L16 3-hydroxylase
MLYLPPHYAHYGVAEDVCMTYSIGFRAPAVAELAHEFLSHLQDTLQLEGMYADPGLRPQKHPAQIGRAMLGQIEAMIARIRWKKSDIAEFAGRYLSEPKPHVFFDAPGREFTRAAFSRQADKHGVALHLKTRMLFVGKRFFINGEAFTPAAGERIALKTLADSRRLVPPIPATLLPRLRDWHDAGWLVIDHA